MGKDWRPSTIDPGAISREAQLDRIETKLDQILSQTVNGFCHGHPFQNEFANEHGFCSICGRPIQREAFTNG